MLFRSPSRSAQALGLLGWLLFVSVAAALGALASRSAPVFYAELVRPTWAPPAWVFGPVWTTLYTLMGIALYRMWMRARRAEADGGEAPSFALFWTQLGLNTAWSLVFFGLRAPFGALATLVALLAAIVATMRAFGRVDRAAALLLAPYAAWVTFAGFLNASVWWLNRE